MAAKLIRVVHKARQHMGKAYPQEATDFTVEVDKNKSISIFHKGELCNTFMVGDQAEYDSYNLSYFGKITSISDTTVCVEKPSYGSGGQKRAFMDLYSFCWRNQGFNASEQAAKNHEEMQYL